MDEYGSYGHKIWYLLKRTLSISCPAWVPMLESFTRVVAECLRSRLCFSFEEAWSCICIKRERRTREEEPYAVMRAAQSAKMPYVFREPERAGAAVGRNGAVARPLLCCTQRHKQNETA
jgi:hypothetical protein